MDHISTVWQDGLTNTAVVVQQFATP